MYGIGGDVCILAAEGDLDHNKIVDVLKIVSDHFLGVLWSSVQNDQVPGSTDGNLIGYVARQDELTLVPTNLDLLAVSK